MQIGMVGLGRMGRNMVRRLLKGDHDVVVYNRTRDKVQQMANEGAIPAGSLDELADKLKRPRVVWLMLPTGEVTDSHLRLMADLLSEGDILVEGSNGYYKEDIRRSKELGEKGIHYMDAGVSGGIWGLEVGYCTMVGGPEKAFRHIEPALKTLAPPQGYLYCGPAGAGHFVKMVHNGIEYAMMEAYGEGFELLRASPYAEQLDLKSVAGLWNQGSVIRSWLLELLEDAFQKDPNLESIQGYVEDSGEGRWAVKEAVDLGVSAGGIALSLFKRFQSRQEDTFSDKVLAALRREFGGHAVARRGDEAKTSQPGAGQIEASRAADDLTRGK